MTRGLKALIVTLIILVGLLATTSGFFYAKTLSLQNQTGDEKVLDSEEVGDNSESPTSTESSSETSTSVAASSAVTAASTASSRPSTPSDTVTVGAGETMSTIAAKLDMNWLTLAEVNGLSSEDANKIKVGQVLVVPKNNQVSFTVNTAKAQELQTKVSGGKDTWRTSAADTAKADSPSVYGLAVEDTFTQKTIDTTAGTATVIGVHNGKNYEIKLTQPATKGDKGVWAIESIKLSK